MGHRGSKCRLALHLEGVPAGFGTRRPFIEFALWGMRDRIYYSLLFCTYILPKKNLHRQRGKLITNICEFKMNLFANKTKKSTNEKKSAQHPPCSSNIIILFETIRNSMFSFFHLLPTLNWFRRSIPLVNFPSSSIHFISSHPIKPSSKTQCRPRAIRRRIVPFFLLLNI